MRGVGIFYDFFFFNERPKWFIYDLKKCGLLRPFSPPEAKKRRAIGACTRCKVKRVKIIYFVRYYLPVFVYNTGTFW